MKRKRDFIDVFDDLMRSAGLMASWTHSAYEALRAGEIDKTRLYLKKALEWRRKWEKFGAEADAMIKQRHERPFRDKRPH